MGFTKTLTAGSLYERRERQKKIFLMMAFVLLAIVLYPVLCYNVPVVISFSGASALGALDEMIMPNEEIAELLQVVISDTEFKIGKYSLSGLQTTIDNVNAICRNTAIVLIVTTFCVSLAQGFIEGTNYDEVVMKKLIVLGMMVACVSSSQKICADLANLGTNVIDEIVEVQESGDGNYAPIQMRVTTKTTDEYDWVYTNKNAEKWDEGSTNDERFYYYQMDANSSIGKYQNQILNATVYKEDDDFWAIGRSIVALLGGFKACWDLFIPSKLSWLSTMLAKSICWIRAIELIVMTAFSPLAFVSLNGHSPIDGVIRFFKSFFAICIQGAIILFTVQVCSILRTTIFTDYAKDVFIHTDGTGFFGMLYNVVIITAAQAGLVARSKSIAQSILGN